MSMNEQFHLEDKANIILNAAAKYGINTTDEDMNFVKNQLLSRMAIAGEALGKNFDHETIMTKIMPHVLGYIMGTVGYDFMLNKWKEIK